jgi:hypothetical protein
VGYIHKTGKRRGRFTRWKRRLERVVDENYGDGAQQAATCPTVGFLVAHHNQYFLRGMSLLLNSTSFLCTTPSAFCQNPLETMM